MTNFLNWNCRGFKNKRDEIKDLLSAYNPACFAFQETYLKKDDKVSIRGYKCFRNDFNHPSKAMGGVALLISNSFPHTLIPLNTQIQAIAVQLHIHQLITICTIYLPPKDTLKQQELEFLISQLPTPFIITGDFNGHNPLWGSSDLNSRGQLIEDILNNNNICLLNNGDHTYFHEPSKSFHAIDLAICSPIIFPSIDFTILNDLHCSDHFPMLLSFKNCNQIITKHSHYIYDRADWTAFTVNALITRDMVEGNIERAVACVTNCIISAADIAIPKTSGSPRKYNKPWWNEECNTAKKQQQKAWGIFRRYPTTTNYISFKKAKAYARKVRRKCQRESWVNYVSGITSQTSSKKLWHRVKKVMGFNSDYSISFLNENGQTITSTKNIANSLGKCFSNISLSNSYTEPFLTYKRKTESSTINFHSRCTFDYNNDFTETELLNSLKHTHLSAPGPDNITYPMLKHLSQDSLNNLLFLYNRIWNEHIFPDAWHNAVVIPFPKPGKDATDPKNYRPIALTSCLCKLFEKMVNSRLVFILETKNLISPWQSGFRRGRSTTDNIIYLETNIRNAFIRQNHLVSVFFDIEKAYDKTWRYGILQDLFNLDFRGNLPIFIKNFLSLRRFQVRIGSVLSDSYLQEEGVPQGSVLSVTLFSLKINDVLKILPHTVKGSLYVDDLQISCQGKDMHFIERQLQLAINRITSWTNKNGFKFSTDKTHCVHFCRLRKLHLDPEIYINRTQISVTDSARFLGVIFDKKLSFIPHILTLRKKCDSTLNLLKVLSNTTWGADRISMLKIYRSVIRSKLDYACEVYGATRKSYLLKLDTVHNNALRICSGAFRTSPVLSLYTDCVEPPLNFIREELSLRSFYRILSHPHHPLHYHLLNTDMDTLYEHRPSYIPHFGLRAKNFTAGSPFSCIHVRPQSHYILTPWNFTGISCLHIFNHFNKSDTSPLIFQRLFSCHRSDYKDYVAIYTDGSKTGDMVGCGIICNDISFSYRLPASFSVFSAEFFAIEKALNFISSHHLRHFIIYTDSKSVLDSLQSYSCSPTFISVLKQYNDLLSKGFHIAFCWVPGHVGIKGNEDADRAAKQATTAIDSDIPFPDLKCAFKKYFRNKWQDYWDNQMNNKLKTIKPHIALWPSHTHRKTDVLITRLRIGHSRLTHRHLLFNEPAPMCPHCFFTVLTIHHILTNCCGLRHLYRLYFHTSSPTLTNLIGEKPHVNVFKFLKDAGFYYNI